MPETLVQLVGDYGVAIVALSVLLMNIGVPIPGHTAYLIAAVLAGRGALALPVLIPVAALSAIAGGLIGFFLGQRGGRRLVLVYGPRVGLTRERLQAMERFFERRGAWAVFFTRYVVVIRTFGAVVAGMSRVPTRLFSIVTTAGAVTWASLYGLAGFFFGDRWNTIEDWLGRAGFVVLGVAAAAGVAHALWRRWRRRR